jgi:Phage integrase, N-terminal SAM-like domain
LNFFTVPIRNANTRPDYYGAVQQFLPWCERAGYQALEDTEPITVAAYIETLQRQAAAATVKQHLTAIWILFSWHTEKGVRAHESGPGNQDREIFTGRRQNAGICRRRGSEASGRDSRPTRLFLTPLLAEKESR